MTQVPRHSSFPAGVARSAYSASSIGAARRKVWNSNASAALDGSDLELTFRIGSGDMNGT